MMLLQIDTRWIEESLQRFEQDTGREVGIDDWGALAAAVNRHAYQFTEGQPYYLEPALRAAVLLQMFVATRPLRDYNGMVGTAVALRYMHECGHPVKAPPGALPQLVTGLRNGSLNLRAAASLLRSWSGRRTSPLPGPRDRR